MSDFSAPDTSPTLHPVPRPIHTSHPYDTLVSYPSSLSGGYNIMTPPIPTDMLQYNWYHSSILDTPYPYSDGGAVFNATASTGSRWVEQHASPYTASASSLGSSPADLAYPRVLLPSSYPFLDDAGPFPGHDAQELQSEGVAGLLSYTWSSPISTGTTNSSLWNSPPFVDPSSATLAGSSSSLGHDQGFGDATLDVNAIDVSSFGTGFDTNTYAVDAPALGFDDFKAGALGFTSDELSFGYDMGATPLDFGIEVGGSEFASGLFDPLFISPESA
ncbi:unnamed protein product [Peniophora sp. CBMAI 1063]|nr:unnamed protein product [Peniophora sp. CBMAI 1063]